MKVLLIALSCIVAFSSLALSFADDKQSDVLLLPFHDGKQWGYMNSKGKTVIPPKYDEARDFSEGFAVVNDGKRYFFIDKSGQTRFTHVLSQYEIWDVSRFKEGRAWFVEVVDKKWKYGLIDNKGKLVIESKYSSAKVFSEGLSRVSLYFPKTYRTIYGFVDRNGKEVIAPKFAAAENFSEGLAVVQTEDGKIQYIDKFGKVKFLINQDKSSVNKKKKWRVVKSGFSEGLARIRFEQERWWVQGHVPSNSDYNKDKVGFVDKKGNWVIKPFYGTSRKFSEGLAAAYDAEVEKWGFIDRKGKWIVEPQFDDARSFSNGLAAVSIVTYPNRVWEQRWGFIDKTGKFQIPLNKEIFWFDKKEGFKKLGYIHDIGDNAHMAVQSWGRDRFEYDSYRLHHEDLLRVQIGGEMQFSPWGRWYTNGGWYYIDRKGKVIGLCKKD